ncbi:MAG: hypothetical protein K2X93_15355 [Candidatus Obscuribacterales bacterium]|nr:hypothetical protein [Candidatus Obscuribacterales bacterium]
MKVISLSLVVVSMMLSQPGLAASLNKDDVTNLDSLEMRFFEHTYKSDSSESRIERLEKFVFGEAKQGDDESRLNDLVASLPKPDPAGAAQSNTFGGDSSADAQQPQQTAAADDEDTSEDYPKIDAMEQVLLGKTFKGQPVAKRLDQLEIKAFKKSSTDSDLSERVTRLSDYVEQHMHKSVDQLVDPRNVYNYSSPGDNESQSAYRAPAYTSYGGGGQPTGSYGMGQALAGGASQDFWAPPSALTSDDAQVAWLENHVFGRSFANAPLLDRLRRLDAAVFPSEAVDTTASIPMQIKVLVNAVELMHSSHPGQNVLAPQMAQAPGQNTGNNFPSWPPQGAQQQQNQYSNYSANAAQNPGTYPYQNGYADTNSQYNQPIQNPQAQQQQEEEQQKHGHPLLKGLAHALLSAGAMAAGSAMMSGMGGMGGYGYGGYGGGYSGMMPGYGGIPGIHF